MLNYDELVAGLESSWLAAGLHDHGIVESVQPDSHERSYKADLFPEHPDPIEADKIPPWVEVNFTWTALHQLIADGRDLKPTDPIDLVWIYNVIVSGPIGQRSDQELVRMFQRAVHAALHKFFPNEITETAPVAVEVRRTYHSDEQGTMMAYVQLVSPNVTDLSSQWTERDPHELRTILQNEVNLASAVIHALRNTFNPESAGHGNYRSVDTA